MKQKIKKYLIASGITFGILVALATILFFGFFSQSVLGWSHTLDDYSNEFKLQDEIAGSYVTEAYLLVPEKTNNFSFTVDYSFRTYFQSSTEGKVFVSYEVYNFNTNQYEMLHSEDWALPNYVKDQTKLEIRGETVYETNIPEHFFALNTRQSAYDRYYGCLTEMTVEQAKALNPWSEGSSSYTYKCLYPDNSLILHDYNKDENWDIAYFPKLITLDTDYINDSKVLFRITVNSKTNGMDSINYNDFDIELWNIHTDLFSYYRFENDSCNEIKLMSYQKTSNDYNTQEECITANSMPYYRFSRNKCTEISILPSLKTENDYLTLAECEFNIVPTKPILLYLVIGIITIFIILIIVYALRRKHRRK